MMKKTPGSPISRFLPVLSCAALAAFYIFGACCALRLFSDSHLQAEPAVAPVFSSPGVRVLSRAPAPSSAPSVSAKPQEPVPSAPPEQAVPAPPSASSKGADSYPWYTPGFTSGKTVYLTFDDGPSSLTGPLLDVLDQYHVKATFFVVGVNDKNETNDLKEIVRRGHAIGVHSWSHDYRQIYASPKAFFEDLDRMHQAIFDATGVDTRLYRFPGGSVNGYNAKTRKTILKGLKQRGYVYFDWNVSGCDTAGGATSGTICGAALEGVRKHRVSVVLFHNTAAKEATLRQVPNFISALKSEGYKFAVLNTSVDNTPFIF